MCNDVVGAGEIGAGHALQAADQAELDEDRGEFLRLFDLARAMIE